MRAREHMFKGCGLGCFTNLSQMTDAIDVSIAMFCVDGYLSTILGNMGTWGLRWASARPRRVVCVV